MFNIMPLIETEVAQYLCFIPNTIKSEYIAVQGLRFWGIDFDNTPCGAIVVEKRETKAVLKYIYIDSDYRYFSGCKNVLKLLEDEVIKLGCDQISVRYLRSSSPAIDKSLSFLDYIKRDDDLGALSIAVGDLRKAKLLGGKESGNATALKDINDSVLKAFGNALIEEGTALISFPIKETDYDMDCSCALINDDKICAILLLKEMEDGNLYIPAIYSDGTVITAPITLAAFMAKAGFEKYDDSKIVRMDIFENKLVPIVEKITETNIEPYTCAVKYLVVD